MLKTDTVTVTRSVLGDYRKRDQRIALVPTMGNLHVGHLSLIRLAQEAADRCIVSIFVNPTQFVEGEDFSAYPRTLERDIEKLTAMNVDVVFTPDVTEIYASDQTVEVMVSALEDIYCGAYRPGHFRGVATVVTKLFNITQPHVAVFGKKDYQQLLLIRALVDSLNMPIEIISGETIREDDGLALSSRNQYLTPAERQLAPQLYASLQTIADAIKAGKQDFRELELQAQQQLESSGFETDYIAILDAARLILPKKPNLVIIAAAKLGAVRLIDNVTVQTYD